MATCPSTAFCVLHCRVSEYRAWESSTHDLHRSQARLTRVRICPEPDLRRLTGGSWALTPSASSSLRSDGARVNSPSVSSEYCLSILRQQCVGRKSTGLD